MLWTCGVVFLSCMRILLLLELSIRVLLWSIRVFLGYAMLRCANLIFGDPPSSILVFDFHYNYTLWQKSCAGVFGINISLNWRPQESHVRSNYRKSSECRLSFVCAVTSENERRCIDPRATLPLNDNNAMEHRKALECDDQDPNPTKVCYEVPLLVVFEEPAAVSAAVLPGVPPSPLVGNAVDFAVLSSRATLERPKETEGRKCDDPSG